MFIWENFQLDEAVPLFCVFKKVFGIPCPGCGTMRSLNALLHGNLVEALWANPVSVILFFAAIALILLSISDKISGKHRAYALTHRKLKPWQIFGASFITIANWIFNLVKFT